MGPHLQTPDFAGHGIAHHGTWAGMDKTNPLLPFAYVRPRLAEAPQLKRKPGASFSERDKVKRRDVPDLDPAPPQIQPQIPSSPTFRYDVPTSPARSSDADFGIDRFERYKTSSYLQLSDAPADSSASAATEVIRQAFDTTSPAVSFEGLGLVEVPHDIGDLDSLVVFGESQALRQLYLGNNRISTLNAALFTYTKLNVLSLRQNRIRDIPPLVANLVNLTDLNIGSNRLTAIPPELLTLPRLTTFRAGPNPFVPVPPDATPVESPPLDRRLRYVGAVAAKNNSVVPSLKTLCLDTVARYDVTYRETRSWKQQVPPVLHGTIAAAIRDGRLNYKCNECDLYAVEPHAETHEWWDLLNNKNVPVRRVFCSGRCLAAYRRHLHALIDN